MTRLAILADLHGNLPALEAVLNDMASFGVEHVVVAGDVINWGPFSAQVTERVLQEGWAVIRGNNEFYLLDHNTPRAPTEWSDPAQYPMLPWLSRQISVQQRTRIAAWPDTLSLRFPDAPPLRVAHGTPRSPWEPMYPIARDEDLLPKLEGVEESTVIVGHTHLPMERRVGRWHVLNPGSVGLPLDGDPTARYMLLESEGDNWRPTIRRVPFDYEPLFREFERQRFVEECHLIGHLAHKEFKTSRLQLLPFLLWRQAQCPAEPLSFDLLARYTEADRWAYTPLAYHVNQNGTPSSHPLSPMQDEGERRRGGG